MKAIWGVLAGILLTLAACGQADVPAVQQGRPAFEPTVTAQITPVPLALTPISTAASLPSLPPLVDSQSSKMLALAGDMLVTVNPDSDSITLVDTASETVLAEIAVGDDPRAVAITPDESLAMIVLRGSNALAMVDLERQALQRAVPICHMPYGVVTDGRRAYVSCLGDDAIAVWDIASGTIPYQIAVGDSPSGLALSGGWLLSTHLYDGTVTVVNVERTPVVVGTVNVEPDGNLASSIVIAPDGGRAYIPQTRTGLALVSLQYMQDWFPVVGVLDLTTMFGDRSGRLTVSTLNYAANMPYDVAFDASGEVMYIVLAGNDMVLAIEAETGDVIARMGVGANPRGIVTNDEKAYVLNALDGSISIIDSDTQAVVNTVQVTDLPLDPILLRGKVLFNSADVPYISDGAISCATCHLDGGADGRTWINFRSGPRNTPALGGAGAIPPYNWAGEMSELHDTIEDQIRNVMLGDGLIAAEDFDPISGQVDAGRSDDLDALVAYVASLEPWPSPYREDSGGLSESAERGMMIFLSGSPSCSCHTPPLLSDLQKHNLTGAAFSLETYADFDTPSLWGLWATAPYMHDGIAPTLMDVFTRTDPIHTIAEDLTEQQLADLIAFLLSL
ncbi:MAG: hypothetical protein H6670_08905 [Anaerolineaceae bacterium]|nr:hypothetical protein [Anaerolineaceae bacterium]